MASRRLGLAPASSRPATPNRRARRWISCALDSAALYPVLSRKLREQTGIDNGYFVCGGLELITSADEDTSDEWRSEGIAFHELNGDELHRRYPYLAAGLERGYFLPDMAQVRNPRHLKALKAACVSQNVQMRPNARRGDWCGMVRTLKRSRRTRDG